MNIADGDQQGLSDMTAQPQAPLKPAKSFAWIRSGLGPWQLIIFVVLAVTYAAMGALFVQFLFGNGQGGLDALIFFVLCAALCVLCVFIAALETVRQQLRPTMVIAKRQAGQFFVNACAPFFVAIVAALAWHAGKLEKREQLARSAGTALPDAPFLQSEPAAPSQGPVIDALNARKPVAELLLVLAAAKPADLLSPDGRDTALHVALRQGSSNAVLVSALLNAGASADQRDGFGVTPLMLAASNASAAEIGLLLDAGAMLETKDRDGATAITFAVLAGKADNVQLLINLGATTTFRQNDGASLPDLARQQGFQHIVAMLEAAPR
jgi:Ankyrin repeats (3 copies)